MFSSSAAAPMELYETPARNLQYFVIDHLQPNQEFLAKAGKAIDLICSFLRENCFKDAAPPRPRILKVVKGGSFGKGTALKGRSDADLVVFLTNFKQYMDQERTRKEMIQEIQRSLREFKNKENDIDVKFEVPKWPNPRVLSFTLSSCFFGDSIEFDVLPAFDALGQYKKGSMPDPWVYIDLIESNRMGEFSTCFTELQRDFIIDKPTKLKSLIRLLKHWYKEYVHPYKAQLRTGESLPPKYALELLAVYAWEQGSGETDFDMAEGFRTVLLLLQQYRQICICWTKFYDFKDETLALHLRNQLRKPRPVILDPADPTGIVGEGSRWDLLAEEAKNCSAQKCCLPHWNVPAFCLHVKLLTGEMLSLSIHPSETIWDLKIKIAQKSGVPLDQQKLACLNNSQIDLQDKAQLSKFGLKSGDILLVVKNEEAITIFVRNDRGRTSTYQVLPSEKVADFKVRVQRQENIQAEQFWLTYNGRPLENDNKLSDYNIAPHGTIFLNMRLRGGCIGQVSLLSLALCFSDF